MCVSFALTCLPKKQIQQHMKSPAIILALSLAANVVLAVVFINRRTFPAIPEMPMDGANPSAMTSAQKSGSMATPLSGEPSDTSSDTAAPNTGKFNWSQLESTEYKEYIARLRAFGVPEKVVRDIIIADIGKLYRPRIAALRPPKQPKNPNFWEYRNQGYYPDRNMTKEQREQMRALQKEQAELIKQLLGADVYEAMAKDSGHGDWTERTYGPLPKETRDKISEMQQRFQEEQSEIYAKADGYIDQDTQADLAALRKKHRAELATILTPEQLEEYELRSSETAQRMRWELSAFEPDEKEFRAIHAFKEAQEELNTARNSDDYNPTPEERKAQQKKQQELEAALADTLGTNRAREYKLMDQYEYRNLFEAGISKDAVLQIVDMKSEVEKATSKLRRDKTLTDEQRQAALLALKTETETTLKGLLGERRAKAYQSQGGYWVRSISPPIERP